MSNKSNIPTAKSIIIPMLVLLLFYNIKFFIAGNKKTEKARYNWQEIKYSDSISPIHILYVSSKILKISAQGSFSPSATPTYVLSNNNQKYFFRFEYRTKHSDTITFFDVHWLNGLPKHYDDISQIKWLDLSLKSPGTNTTVTIGDEFMCRGNAEFLRLTLNKKKHLKFLGPQKDVFNFGYLARPNAKIPDLVTYAKIAPQAQYYILFFRLQDNIELNQFIAYLTKIQEILKQKHPHKIFWILPDSISRNLETFNSSNNIIIDYNWKLKNSLPTKKNYETLAKKISQHIHQ